MSELENRLETALRKNVAELEKIRKKFNQLDRMQNEPIAIIGMSCRMPGGVNSPDSYWDLLCKGIDGISEVPKERWDIDSFYDPDSDAPGKMSTRKGGFVKDIDLFDADFFRVSPREAQAMDPQQRLLLEVTWEALESGGIAPSSLENTQTGVFIGSCNNDYCNLMQSGFDLFGMHSALGISANALNGRISYLLGLLGPSMTVDTACSSSLVSLHLACTSLQRGESHMAIAGGVNLILSPAVFIMLSRAKMLSPDGHCKTFDASGDGYARGEGVGVVILKRLSDAERDRDNILAVIRSTAVNQDGSSSSLTVPNGVAQVKLIEQTLAKANLKPIDISYMEAHGTGTQLGDPIEVEAIQEVYGKGRSPDNPLLLGSVKSNIGHLEGAAGIAGVIKVILSLQHETIPPNLHFTRLNPKIHIDAIPAKIITSPTPWKKGEKVIRRAGISGFGFTGTNAHAIIEEAPLFIEKEKKEEPQLDIFTLSAKTETALKDLIQNYLVFLNKTDVKLSDICFTANTGRDHERYRIAVIARDINDLKEKLKKAEFPKIETKDKGSYELISTGDWQKDLNYLASAYTEGATVDWKKFYASYTGKKVTLPTYPFQRKRYWSDAATLYQPQEANLDDWFYLWTWQEHLLGATQMPDPLGYWLVLSDDHVSEDVIKLFRSNGGSCKCVPLSDHPKTKEEYIVLMQDKSLAGILHLSSTNDFGLSTDKGIKEAQSVGAKSFLHLCQALVQLKNTLRIPTFLITREIASINFVQSPLNGLYKSVMMEYPDLPIKHIDLGSIWKPEILYQTCFEKSDETIFYIQGNQCYVPRLMRMQDLKRPAQNVIKSNSTYLITGGLGGLGLTLAKWLKEKGAGHIVLAGRRERDDEIDSTINAIEKDATKISYISLDISNEKAIEEQLKNLNQSDKPLKGIFHLAGVVDAADLMNQDWALFEKIFAAKVYGSFYLHQYSKDLDLFVMFSSLSSTLGTSRQENYAAANAFMDGLSEFRKQAGLPAHCLSWGPWAEVGMAKELVSRFARDGLIGMKPKSAMLALELALSSNQAQITIADVNWKNYIGKVARPPAWLRDFGEQKINEANLVMLLEKSPENGRFSLVKEYVSERLRRVLGFEPTQQIDVDKGFFDMGIDSLLAIELKNHLQSGIGQAINLLPTAVFDYPSVEKLSNYIAEILNIPTSGDIAKKEKETIMSTLINKNWLLQEKSIEHPKFRVFCFHHAGGSASSFKGWQNNIPKDVQLNMIQLPGRDERFGEPLITEISAVAFGIVQAMLGMLDTPYIIFAHSMGAMVASEVVLQLQKMRLTLPRHMILSGISPLYYDLNTLENVHRVNHLNDDEFVDFLIETETLSRQFVNDREALKIFLPIVRADFALLDTRYHLDDLLNVPITTIFCKDDKSVTESSLNLWSKVTKETYRNITLSGGHLTLLENPKPFIEIIESILKAAEGL